MYLVAIVLAIDTGALDGTMKLDYSIAGHGDPPLLLLHGFTGGRDSFAHLFPNLRRRIVCVDLPGHGSAPLAPSGHAGWHETVAALHDILSILQAPCVDILGYSQGARLALALALLCEEGVRHLVLESGSPGLNDANERLERTANDERLAQQIEHEGVHRFIDLWQAQPLFATFSRLPLRLRQDLRARRLRHTAPGLASALRSLGVGTQPSYWSELTRLRAHVLLLTGAHDTKFTTIARCMMTKLLLRPHEPHARAEHVIFDDCGHAPHLEVPVSYVAAVARFLRTA